MPVQTVQTVQTVQVDPGALVAAGWALAGLAARVTAGGRAVEVAVDAATPTVGDAGVAAALALYLATARQAHDDIGDALTRLAQRVTAAALAYSDTDGSLACAAGPA